MKRELLFICFLMALLLHGIDAQSNDRISAARVSSYGYACIQSKAVFGVSNFSLFRADKTCFACFAGKGNNLNTKTQIKEEK